MYEVIGHEYVREELAKWDEAFVIVGPEGVGRNGIRMEKFQRMRPKAYLLDPSSVRHTDEGLVLDKPLSSASLLQFVTSYDSLVSTIPIPGIRNFFVGKLTDQNVTDILRRDYPKVMSRALVVSMLDGSFQRFNEIHFMVEAFEAVTEHLTTHSVPTVINRYLIEATSQACLSRLNAGKWAFNSSLVQTIPEFLALWFFEAEPTLASTTQFYYGLRDGYVD